MGFVVGKSDSQHVSGWRGGTMRHKERECHVMALVADNLEKIECDHLYEEVDKALRSSTLDTFLRKYGRDKEGCRTQVGMAVERELQREWFDVTLSYVNQNQWGIQWVEFFFNPLTARMEYLDHDIDFRWVSHEMGLQYKNYWYVMQKCVAYVSDHIPAIVLERRRNHEATS